MRHYHKNPRQITKKQFADLQYSLRKFGDLSGVVHNLQSDEIIGGNQRMDVFDLKTAQIELTERLDQPDEQGTVARGWVIWQGNRYTYRAVMWDEKMAEEANIRANKAGGTWDVDLLANQFEIPDLIEWGFMPYELGIVGVDGTDDPNAAWAGMPEFEHEDQTDEAAFTIRVFLKDADDLAAFGSLLGKDLTGRKFVWFSKQPRGETYEAHDGAQE